MLKFKTHCKFSLQNDCSISLKIEIVMGLKFQYTTENINILEKIIFIFYEKF
jgi:hypothetical protein